MRIRIEFSVDVDPQQWMDLQSVDTPAEVREDVKRWAKANVLEALSDEGVLLR